MIFLILLLSKGLLTSTWTNAGRKIMFETIRIEKFLGTEIFKSLKVKWDFLRKIIEHSITCSLIYQNCEDEITKFFLVPVKKMMYKL